MNVANHKLSDLKRKIHRRTGIPPSNQHLYHGNKRLSSQEALNNLGDQANLHLMFWLCGGKNECDVCFDEGQFFCSECKQHLCAECNRQIHKHPKRVNHLPQPIEQHKVSDSFSDIADEELDAIVCSPSFDLDSFEENS